MKNLLIKTILLIFIIIFTGSGCSDYNDYSYTPSNDPMEPIESPSKRLHLYSDGYFGIYSDLIPVTVLWDTDTKQDIWDNSGANAIVSDITADTFEGFKSWRFEGTGTWMGIGVRVNPTNASNYKDLSIYSNGHLNFAYKGTNGFKVGMSSGTLSSDEVWYNHTSLSNYGLRLDNTWCEISIPITNFATVQPSFDLSSVFQYFIFVSNGPTGYSVGVVHFIDNVHLTKD